MVKITKDMTIGEILRVDYNLAAVLMGGGMYCIGCPASYGESLEEAAMVHGIDPDLLLERLNAYLESKATKEETAAAVADEAAEPAQ